MGPTIALIVAGGRGERLPGSVPKQYRDLAGRPVLAHALARFLRHPAIDAVQAVIHGDDASLYAEAAAGLDLLSPVIGGSSRQRSVRSGLEAMAARDPSPARIVIHDGVRPLVTSTLIDRVLAALTDARGAITALPVTDTLKRGADGRIEATVDRAGLWRAQTPQAFQFEPLLAAHRAAADRELTDDAAVAEAAGIDVALVNGDPDNLKITSAEDLDQAARILAAANEYRVGTGYDVHRFGAGDHVVLGGVPIPHSHGLVGHSDADVALHAATDAVLGAIGAGDIGLHFPQSDARWKGAASEQFLAHATALVAKCGGEIVNLDVTVICERPAIGPHRDAMAARMAALLAVPVSRVSVKATTTDGLGFTGRGEGIAAQAVATVRLPR